MISSFLSSEYPPVAPIDALFHIVPVPFEATVSYGGGTAGGPQAILDASNQLEANDGWGRSPGKSGFYTHAAVECRDDANAVFERISAKIGEILALPGTHLPVVLGGEHSITYPVLRPFVEKYGRGQIGVVQVDAHADLHDRYKGNPLSHACVMRRLHADLGISLVQLGVRALCQEEIDYRAAHSETIFTYDARELISTQTTHILLPDHFPPYLFLSIDVDGLDPSVMPATGTPVPGGLGWYPLLALIESVLSQRTLIGFDVVELAPIEGIHFPSYTAAELVHKVMGSALAARGSDVASSSVR